MPGTLTITSTSFTSGALIPPLHKNATVCAEPNLSPQISWTTGGDLLPNMVESYQVLVDDLTVAFVHWDVIDIDPIQTGILENGSWAGVPPIINPTSWGTGDAPNGWNGPCAPNGTDNTYLITVKAHIKEEYIQFLSPGHEAKSLSIKATYRFSDNNTNVSPPESSGDCGSIGCPPGSTLEGGLCQTITSEAVTISSTVYLATEATSSTAWGWGGTRFYAAVDIAQVDLPLSAPAVDAELRGSDGAGPLVPFSVINGTNTVWDPTNVYTSILNSIAVWTDDPCASGNCLPVNEWIGFSQCIIVPETKTYCIGLAADNYMRFKINGQPLATFPIAGTSNFTRWHVIEVTLQVGANIIEMEGKNSGIAAGFGAEIYDTDILNLQTLTTRVELDAVVLFSTIDLVTAGQIFDIGESSGYICPDGTAYDSCTGGLCSSITFEDPDSIDCCQRIENCADENETYLIWMDPAETELIFQDYLYVLAGSDLFTDKCFKFVEVVPCTIPDIDNVTVTTTYPTDNCGVCDPSHKVESCANPGEFTYITLALGEVMLIGNIYELNQLEGCQIYIGPDDENPATKLEAIITTDYATQSCEVCIPCYEFRNCVTGTPIYVRFTDGTPLPNGDDFFVYGLGGNIDLEDICWQFIGEAICQVPPPYLDITLVKDYECASCEICIPYYKLTNCIDPLDVVYIQWEPSAPPLTPGTAYIFDFTPSPNECYTAELEYSPCPPSELIDIPYWLTACVYSFMEDLSWINFIGQTPGQSFVYNLPSIIIDGVQYVIGAAPTYSLTYTGSGIIGLDESVANNDYGLTYNDQVNGFNAIFIALGIDHLIKAQVVLNDEWAGTAVAGGIVQGGLYLITRSDVTTFAIQVNDGSSYTIEMSEGLNTMLTGGNIGGAFDNVLGYEFHSCVDTLGQPFVVDPTTGVVTEG